MGRPSLPPDEAHRLSQAGVSARAANQRRRRDELIAAATPLEGDSLRYLARNGDARVAHLTGNMPRPAEVRGHPTAFRLTADHKLDDAQSLDEALRWLTSPERIEVASDQRMLEKLAALPNDAV